MLIPYNLGDVVETKKVHPCGGNRWEVIRIGVDYKIKCLKCARIVLLDNVKMEKVIKKPKSYT